MARQATARHVFAADETFLDEMPPVIVTKYLALRAAGEQASH